LHCRGYREEGRGKRGEARERSAGTAGGLSYAAVTRGTGARAAKGAAAGAGRAAAAGGDVDMRPAGCRDRSPASARAGPPEARRRLLPAPGPLTSSSSKPSTSLPRRSQPLRVCTLLPKPTDAQRYSAAGSEDRASARAEAQAAHAPQ
jgi:hypothetical protein